MAESFMQKFLKKLSGAKHDLSGSHSGGNNLSRIKQMDNEIRDMTDFLPEVPVLDREKLVMEKLDGLGDEIIEDIFEKIKEEIQEMGQNPFAFDRNTSDDLPKDGIEKSILESTAVAYLEDSYCILEPKLKQCLLCFSVFPEDSVIKVRSLIYWWIGEGLADNEEKAKECYNNLLEMGMIRSVNKNSVSEFDRCTIEPWVYSMLCSRVEIDAWLDFDNDGKLTNDTSRRAFLFKNNNIETSKQEDLLVLFNIDAQYLNFKRDWFSTLKKIYVLQLGRWQNSADYHIEVHDTDFLKGLRGQKQLRYLSLQGISRITELPDFVSDLANVQILDLRACHNLEKLPAGITSMYNLTHLDVSECYLLEFMPKGFQHLSKLQVLKGFVVGDSKRKDSCRLSELARLMKLRKLTIHVISNAGLEREIGQLKQVESLRILRITWGTEPVESSSKEDSKKSVAKMPLPNLPQELEKLELEGFHRSKAPAWLKPSVLTKLKRLYIRGGRLETLEKEDGHSWNIKVLRLKFLKNFQIEWLELCNIFPNAAYIEKVKCDKVNASPGEGVWERQ